MDLQHLVLAGVIITGIAIPIVWFWPMPRSEPKKPQAPDDPVDAAASLVIKDLSRRFERSE